jgi:membrane associated rhomboid family serine protease
MGIYDREYYRDATRGSGFFSGLAPACKALILANVGIYLLQWIVFDGPEFYELFAASSSDIFERGRVWQLLTAAFLHSPTEPFHLVFNMFFLWMFGREIESMYGHREFVAMYLTAAVFSTLVWATIDYFGTTHGAAHMVGASGAITAVVVLCTLYYPSREILLFFVVPVQMWLMLVIYLGIDFLMLVNELKGKGGGGTAFAAHLGGAAYGFLYKHYDLRLTKLWAAGSRRPKFRVVSPEPRDKAPLPAGPSRSATAGASRPASTPVFPEEQLDARLDEILAKIAREGRGGLTDEENRILQEASRRARDRRNDRF